MSTKTRMSRKGLFILTVGLLALLGLSLAQLRADHFVRPNRDTQVAQPATNEPGGTQIE